MFGKKVIDMTSGPIASKIIAIAIPTLCMNLIQILYNTADTMIVGLSGEGDAIGAVGSAGFSTQLIINIVLAFSTTANIIVSRHIGAKDEEKTSRAVYTTMFCSLALGLIAMFIGMILARPLMLAIGLSGKILTLAVTYTRFYFIGAPFMALTNTLLAIFRAKGDTKRPFVVLTITGCINVLFNLFFVLVFNMATAGVALATAIANACSCVVLFAMLYKEDGPCKLIIKRKMFDKEEFSKFFRLGAPYALQNSIGVVGDMMAQTSLVTLNSVVSPPNATFAPAMKANSAVGNLSSFTFQAHNVVSQTAMSFVGQNIGAKKYKRLKKINLNAILLSIVAFSIVAAIILIVRNPLLSLYGIAPAEQGTAEQIAYELASIKMFYVFVLGVFSAFSTACLNLLRALGKSFQTMLIAVGFGAVFSIIWNAFIFPLNPTIHMFLLRGFLSSVMTGVCAYVYLKFAVKKLILLSKKGTI